ncbi:MAG: signal peptidase II [Rhodospirillaceae bacterium]
MRRVRARLTLGLGIAAIVAALDQLVKWYVVTGLMQPPRVIEVTGWLNLVMTWNHGISFGFFSGDAVPYVLAAVALAVVAGLIVWMINDRRPAAAVWLGLVIGGALGNVVDRLRLGAVADFIDVHAGVWHWPAFNVADGAITIGVTLILIDGLFGRSEMS